MADRKEEQQLPFSAQTDSEVQWKVSTDPNPGAKVDSQFIVKLKGFPFDSKKTEIASFLHDCTIKNGHDGIHLLVGPDNRPSGSAIVELENHASMQKAVDHDHQNMGSRYVEITIISEDQMKAELSRQPEPASGGDFFVKLRGMPYSSKASDVVSFLSDCQVVGGESGIHFTVPPDGRASGEAYVELLAEEDVSKAVSHNREHMGRRYVEIFRATRGQMEWDCRKGGVDEGGVGGGGLGVGLGGGMGEGLGQGGVVRLRGLPFGCTEDQVQMFFSGLKVVMGGVVFQTDPGGRETGEAFVKFHSQADADEALGRDRNKIGHRYIEVFRSSHAEIRPVKGGPPTGGRPTPYDRPGATQPYGGFSDRRGSGYERQYHGARGRGAHMGGAQYPMYGYGTGGYYGDAPPQEFYAPPPQAFHTPTPSAPRGDQSLVSYPPIRPSPQQPKPAGTGSPSQPGKTRFEIRMRGLPYSAKEKDIEEFFAPTLTTLVDVDLDSYGRPSGEALVYFNSHEDALAGMQKNNNHMGHRYIELFLNSEGPDAPPSLIGQQQQRYPAQQQAAWSDPRTQQQAASQMGMYGGAAAPGGGAGYAQPPQVAAQQQQQQAQRQPYAGYQQQQPTAQPVQQQPQQQPQQQGYQQNTGYGYGQQQQQQAAVGTGYGHQQSAPQQHSWY